MNRFLIFALLSVCVCAELFKQQNAAKLQNVIERLYRNKNKAANDLFNPLKRQNLGHQARNDKRGLFEFTPVELPCTYVITSTTVERHGSEEPVRDVSVRAKSSDTYLLTTEYDAPDETHKNKYILARDDHKYVDEEEDTTYIPVAEIDTSDAGGCCHERNATLYELRYVFSDEHFSPLFDFEYDDVHTEFIDGVEYYVFVAEEETVRYYVNESKFVTKIVKTFDDGESVQSFSYIFDDADKELFKLDNNTCDSCEDGYFYEAPEDVIPCWYPPYPDMNELLELAFCGFSFEGTKQINGGEPVSVKCNFAAIGGEIFDMTEETINGSTIVRVELNLDPQHIPVFIAEDDQCIYTEYGLQEYYIMMYYTFPYISFLGTEREETKCDYKESVTWDGEQCTKYCSEKRCFTFKDAEPRDLVGLNFSLAPIGIDMYFSMNYTKIEALSSADVFKLDNNTNPGCMDEHPGAYESPVLPYCGANYISLELSPLPCLFAVTVNLTEILDGGEEETKTEILAMNSRNVAVYYWPDGSDTYVEVLRGDLATDSGRVPYLSGKVEPQLRCEYYGTVSESSASESLDYWMSKVFYKYSDYDYESKTTTTIDGVVYSVYNSSDIENDAFTVVYVDENGFIAKVDTFDEDSGSLLKSVVYKYTFNDVNMSIFKVEESPCDGTDTGFYREPAMNGCHSLKVHDPSKAMCAFSVESEVEKNETVMNYKFYFSYEDKKKLPVFAIEDKDTGTKEIYRGDIFRPSIREGPSLITMVAGINDSCTMNGVNERYLWNAIEKYFAVFMDEFGYINEEEMSCEEGDCTRYCSDIWKRTCVTVLNSEPRYVLKYESASFNMTYGVPAEVDDMSVFALDKDKFPGCGDNSKAYENPEIICTPSSSDVSSGAGSDSGSGAGSSGAGSHSGSAIVSSESLSSASVVDVAVAALIFSFVVALL